MIGLDYETWCELDLKVVGLDRYVNHSSFRVLVAAVSYQDDSTLVLDFVQDKKRGRRLLKDVLLNEHTGIAVHNAGFERAVTARLNINVEPELFKDSAVVARCMGAASKLEHAAQQLLNEKKLDAGGGLLRKFSLADKCPDWDAVKDDIDWMQFKEYCRMDADLSLSLVRGYGNNVEMNRELTFEAITQGMNDVGWRVDMAAVDRMSQLYEQNKVEVLHWFQTLYDTESELNFNSPIQLVKWCKDRGINARSFDEEHVIAMHASIKGRLQSKLLKPMQKDQYIEVASMLATKMVLGGSSLKKLKVIKNTTGNDGQLRNQYMHVGAGQTYRTSGRGVQMQNLKRLSDARDMDELFNTNTTWTNDELAENLRQVFTAQEPTGKLIVGDFSSVEARGLAYLAGQEDTLAAFRSGLDLYKVQAAALFHTQYHLVTKEQRRTGKVGVLACGYQAGGEAVQSFAKGMGVELSAGESAKLVQDWRTSNDKIVKLWATLHELLLQAVGGRYAEEHIGNDLLVSITPRYTPATLVDMHPGAQSIQLELKTRSGEKVLSRLFHGCYMRGRNVNYYKPDVKNGKLWSKNYRNPKTKQIEYYNLYGGKISGILTQSMCRELFFSVLESLQKWAAGTPGVQLIGQFHDEAVFDWNPKEPGAPMLENAIHDIKTMMSDPHDLYAFPLTAEVKADYRYTK